MFLVIRLKNLIFFIIVIVITSLLIDIGIKQIYAVRSDTPKDNFIIIDPGHGGRDPGASSKDGIKEKDINLKISNKLKKCLIQNGYSVLMTRETDISLHDEDARKKKSSDISNRLKFINDNNAKMVISIHLNSFSQSKYSGAQVFYGTNNTEGKVLGKIIQEELKNNVDSENNREAKPINTVIMLRKITVPSVIVECGFLSNPTEANLLNTDEYQEKLAQAICSGVKKYFVQIKSTT